MTQPYICSLQTIGINQKVRNFGKNVSSRKSCLQKLRRKSHERLTSISCSLDTFFWIFSYKQKINKAMGSILYSRSSCKLVLFFVCYFSKVFSPRWSTFSKIGTKIIQQFHENQARICWIQPFYILMKQLNWTINFLVCEQKNWLSRKYMSS